ncbi:MAG TPA: CoA transferase [Candidatus Baltobacterales bacterium]|nr:CoA transferase [Candidatus Baltobacterales bacterium]
MSRPTKPLDGIKVLAFEVQVAGPYCTMMLADQGASVIKVERPEGGDTARGGAPMVKNDAGETQSGYFLRFNRNKRSLTLNLKSDQGRRLFTELAGKSDVLVENFRPGLLDEMGIGYKALSEHNPGLIYACISGFGSLDGYLGPYSKRPAYDIVAQAMGGLMNTCGQADGPPTWLGVALGDIVSGMNAAYAIMLALYQRTQTGRGQYIDISMYDTIVGLAERSMTAYSLTQQVLERGRERYMAPWGPFQCQDGYVGVIVATEGDWAKFCQAIERSDLVGREGATSGPERASNMSGWLGEIINGWFSSQTKAEASAKLLAVGLPVGPVQTAKEIFDDPHVAARRLMIDVPDPILGSVRLVGPVAKMSGDPRPILGPAPLLGQHNTEILTQVLGYTPEQAQELKQDGVV